MKKIKLSDLIRYYIEHDDFHYALILIFATYDEISLNMIYKIVDIIKNITNINISKNGIRSWLHEQVYNRKILINTSRGIYKNKH